jgi:hypothetical protein
VMQKNISLITNNGQKVKAFSFQPETNGQFVLSALVFGKNESATCTANGYIKCVANVVNGVPSLLGAVVNLIKRDCPSVLINWEADAENGAVNLTFKGKANEKWRWDSILNISS